MIWFSADYHFYHHAIIQYCNRPFKNVATMEKVIIKNHNELVQPNDDVYILGDFSMLGPNNLGLIKEWASKLNGKKHLVMGNHDELKPQQYVGAGFQSVHYPYLELFEFILVHDPALAQVDRERWFLCGHIHDLFKVHKNCYNVGVDVRGFKPVSLEQIRHEMYKLSIK